MIKTSHPDRLLDAMEAMVLTADADDLLAAPEGRLAGLPRKCAESSTEAWPRAPIAPRLCPRARASEVLEARDL